MACCPETSRLPRQPLSYTSRLASESRASAYPRKDLPRRVYGARDRSDREHILSPGMGVVQGKDRDSGVERQREATERGMDKEKKEDNKKVKYKKRENGVVKTEV